MKSRDKNSPIESEQRPAGMARRQFLVRSLQVGVGGVVGLSIGSLTSGLGCDGGSDGGTGSSCADDNVTKGSSATISSAWIAKGKQESSYAVFQSMVEGASDFSWLRSGDRVLLKLALNSGNAFPATTDPWLLGCMIDLLKSKGAGTILVGDQSGIYQSKSTRTCLQDTGLMTVIQQKGATAICFEESAAGGHKSVAAANWSSNVNITKVVDQVDHIIYLPRIATHTLASKTFSLKIAVGFLNSASRSTMHGGSIRNLYPSINDIPDIKNKFRMSVTSARKLMTSGGPDSGTTVEPNYGLIFASSNLLAANLMAGAFLAQTTGSTEDIYCHEAVQSYIDRNGNLDKLAWNSINAHPDSAVTSAMVSLLKKVVA